MKMQEVITQLRELAPVAAASSRLALKNAEDLRVVFLDLQHAQSFESMKALADLAHNKLTDMFVNLDNCANDTGKLQALNESYKEKLGPRGPKKPKDATGQQMLPGIGGEGGTPTTVGETTMNDTSTTGGRTTPSFIRSGRHG